MNTFKLDTVIEDINDRPTNVHKIINVDTGAVVAECTDIVAASQALLDLNGVDLTEWGSQ